MSPTPSAAATDNPQADACATRILARFGQRIALAAPLGLGKPNHLINAIYRRVVADQTRSLTIYTALSLSVPGAHSDIERRFLTPFAERHFGADYPELDYVTALRANRLPTNVRVQEFYFQSGAMLGSKRAQRDYASINYTHVARDLAGIGVDVVVQLIAQRGQRYSLSSNPDVSLDLIDMLVARGLPRPYVVGVVSPHLPFLGHDAEVGREFFDEVLADTPNPQPLFALPREPVTTADFAIGLHASTLVRDGGTLQIGIGALSDALVYALLLRHQRNADFHSALTALRGALGEDTKLLARCGGTDAFARGLYGVSELVMDGFMHLRRGGVLVRNVYDDLALQRALDAHVVGETLVPGDAARLREADVLPKWLDRKTTARLIALGLLPEDATWNGDAIALPDGTQIARDLSDPRALETLDRVIAGRQLAGGRYLRGAFFLGSRDFYAWLCSLQGADYDGLAMTRVSDVNQLYGGSEILDATQRREARFFNICMMATVLGAAVSDALEDGRVVSGVGGQYNFVAMAHALEHGRSVLMLRATRETNGRVESNIRYNYGHTTIPRHLRDVFVTEYGIADLRGKSDEACIRAMLAITDARFQQALADQAIAAGKLAADFRIPDAWRANTPERLAEALAPLRARGDFGDFPFGSDFTPVEQRLLPALLWLKRQSATVGGKFALAGAVIAPGQGDAAALARMGLERPHGLKERLLARIVRGALSRTEARG